MRRIKCQIKKGKKWYFRFIASNGRILCHSEQYESKRGARKGLCSLINAVRNNLIKGEEDGS